jgi:hypothetical protein
VPGDVQTIAFNIEPESTAGPFPQRLRGRPRDIQDHTVIGSPTHTQSRQERPGLGSAPHGRRALFRLHAPVIEGFHSRLP